MAKGARPDASSKLSGYGVQVCYAMVPRACQTKVSWR